MLRAIIKASILAQLRALRRYVDVKEHSAFLDQKDYLYKVSAIISSDDKEKLESRGYTVEIKFDLSETVKARLKEVSRVNRFSEMNTTSNLEAFTVAGGYMNVDEIEDGLLKFKSQYKELVEVIELPNKTHEGRTSRAIRLHTSTGKDKPAVMFIGGVHAREWGTSDICMHFANKLLANFESSSPLEYGNKIFNAQEVRTILDNIDIIVFPDVNPDGKAHSQKADDPNKPNTDEIESVWWRKNRNPNSVPYPYPEDKEVHKTCGVDLNRNFDFLWYSGIGTINEDGTDASINYKGTQAFSEPESRNVKSLFDRYKNIVAFVDLHCHVGQILCSWGEDDTQSFYPDQNYRNPSFNGKRGRGGIPSDNDDPELYGEYMHPLDLQRLASYATRMNDALHAVRGSSYETKPSVGLYPTTGSSQDYAFSQRMIGDENRSRISAYTIEFGSSSEDEDTFIPEYHVMQNIMNDVASALTELCLAVATENYSK